MCRWVSILFLCVMVPRAAAAHSAPSRIHAGRTPASRTLQRDFVRASREFHVPLPVLLAVSYQESRWEGHGGAPSTDGGYGPMHLVRVPVPEDARGDGHRHGGSLPASLRTLDLAAHLLHLPARVLQHNESQNIRGGAALLRLYAAPPPRKLGGWANAVARYSGSRDAAVAADFVLRVFATIRSGAQRMTAEGQRVVLAPHPIQADSRVLVGLGLRADQQGAAECPQDLPCRFVPAAYQVNSTPMDYGNYDAARRARDGMAVRYIIIHDTESPYTAAVNTFQDPHRYASANYVIRSSDGQVTQMVPTRDVAWHAGNYYVNMHSIGIEHEGYAVSGATWYSEQMYESSALLVRYLASRYHIPLDREHIIGHDEVSGPTPLAEAQQHWDPGPFWDWAHYMDLLGAPLPPTGEQVDPVGAVVGGIINPVPTPTDTGAPNPVRTVVTIDPPFAGNMPPVTDCSSTPCRTLRAQPANFVPLHVAPDAGSPLLGDAALHGAGDAGTSRADDWGDKAVTGEQFFRVAEQGDWDAIDYAGKQAWFYNPGHNAVTAAVTGQTATPRPGLRSIHVYGWPVPNRGEYPKSVTVPPLGPLQYTIPAGQRYVVTDHPTTDYYWSPTMSHHRLIHGRTRYLQIRFNHRIAFLRTADVVVQSQ